MKRILVFLFALEIFLLLPREVSAAISINITSSPSEARIGEEFILNISITGLEVGASYYIKSRIGKTSSEMNKGETFNELTSSWPGDTDSWTDFPTISANLEGSSSASLKSRAKLLAELGENLLAVRLRKVGGSSNAGDSDMIIINLLEAPTPTLTPTPEPTPTPTIPSPTHTPVPPTPTPTVTPTTVPKATYKINEVKNTDGNILSSVKIYVDGNYVHHYTPETITFCENCQCYTDVNCHFGSHLIKLEKANYADWAESKTFNSGDNYEVNPIMQVLSLTASASSTPTPTPTNRVSSTPTPSPTIKPTDGEILGAEDASESFELALNNATDSSLPNDGDATVAGVAKSNKLPPSWPFIGIGSAFLAAMVSSAVIVVRKKLSLS